MSTYRPEFEDALRVFASVSEAVESAGFQRPILVGGAAVEFYSASAIATGDFDVVTARRDVLEKALLQHGFEKPSGPGVLLRGWIHPDLRLGFEVVGTDLLDGHADRDTVQLIDAGKGEHFAVISVEDLIADRMGQYHSGTAPEMLEQAKTLFKLYKDADITYMERRIREETANEYGVAELESAS
jgi:hypothetical protein